MCSTSLPLPWQRTHHVVCGQDEGWLEAGPRVYRGNKWMDWTELLLICRVPLVKHDYLTMVHKRIKHKVEFNSRRKTLMQSGIFLAFCVLSLIIMAYWSWTWKSNLIIRIFPKIKGLTLEISEHHRSLFIYLYLVGVSFSWLTALVQHRTEAMGLCNCWA